MKKLALLILFILAACSPEGLEPTEELPDPPEKPEPPETEPQQEPDSLTENTLEETGNDIVKNQLQQIKTSLETAETTRVIINLKGNEFTSPDFKDLEKKQEEISKIQEQVLATLTEDNFILKRKFSLTTGIAGDLTESGYQKLIRNPDVEQISPDLPVHTT